MRSRNRGNKTIDIRLDEEKYYFPGELIKGKVLLHLKSAVKTSYIRIKFSGEVQLSIKDKETYILFQQIKTLPVANDDAKTHVLAAKQHIFPFEFVVPKDLELPSSMEFGKRRALIRYMLSAVQHRPLVPESLCAKADYVVHILEFVDITSDKFAEPEEKSVNVVTRVAKHNQRCQLKGSLPRSGYTRGDIVPLRVVVNHFETCVIKSAMTIDLVRIVEIRTLKNTTYKEQVLQSLTEDVNIIGPYNFSQETSHKLLIPSSTPPTVTFKEHHLRVHYKARVKAQLGAHKETDTALLEIPIIIGTWPRASVPIDDDDDDELALGMGDLMISDDESDDDLNNTINRRVSDPVAKRRSIISSGSSAGLTIRPSNSATGVGRSSSSASRSSIHSASSFYSNHSVDNVGMIPEYGGYGNPSPSTPEFAHTNVIPRSVAPSSYTHSRTSVDLTSAHWGHRASYYENLSQENFRIPSTTSNHRASKSLHYPQMAGPSSALYHSNTFSSGYGHSRGSPSDDHSYLSAPQPLANSGPPPSAAMYNVPTHVLQPIPSPGLLSDDSHMQLSSSSPYTSSPVPPAYPSASANEGQTYMSTTDMLSDDDDDSDDNDLLAIIEKRKKRAMRQA